MDSNLLIPGIYGTEQLVRFMRGKEEMYFCRKCKAHVLPVWVADREGMGHPACEICFLGLCLEFDAPLEHAVAGAEEETLEMSVMECDTLQCRGEATSSCQGCNRNYCVDCMSVPGARGLCRGCTGGDSWD